MGAAASDDGIDDVDDGEEAELDAEPHKAADDVCDRHREAREIDLAEDAGIVHEGVGGLVQAVCEILPHAGARKVEERTGNAVGRDAGDAAEYYHIHYHRQRRLNHEPHWAEDGLLVLGDDVSLDEEGDEVAVLPDFLEVDLEEAVPWFDDRGPVVFVYFYGFLHSFAIGHAPHEWIRAHNHKFPSKLINFL